jgi:hypothetical protein
MMFLVALVFVPTSAVAFAAEVETETEQEQTTEEIAPPETEADPAVDWREWFNDKALPILIAVGAGIVTIISFLYPVLSAVNRGVKLFKRSKSTYEAVTEKVIATQGDITDFKNTSLVKIAEYGADMKNGVAEVSEKNKSDIDAIREEMEATLSAFGNQLAELVKVQGYNNQIMKIAFANDERLVKNGYANEIMKVGVDNGSAKTETSDSVVVNP